MARKPRRVIPDTPHHIYSRGNNRRRLFSSEADYRFFLRCLERGLRASRSAIHQLTLMTNHFHLIVTPKDKEDLSEMMKRCNHRYAQIRNDRRKGSGKLFEERFSSKPIKSEEQLIATTLYNDSNAYRAGMVATPFDHKWSTAALHAGCPAQAKIPLDLWTPSPWYAALGRTPDARAERYRAAMQGYLALGAPRPEEMEVIEETCARYTRRLERPDGTSAREPNAAEWSRDLLRLRG
jgi:putative transposase